uniref:Uncharacterized protein n=1 Tax=Oryza punctata TaxID=4537 RepID=A0A0E0K0G6_ORYPU
MSACVNGGARTMLGSGGGIKQTRFCSHCRGHDHNITKCPEVVGVQHISAIRPAGDTGVLPNSGKTRKKSYYPTIKSMVGDKKVTNYWCAQAVEGMGNSDDRISPDVLETVLVEGASGSCYGTVPGGASYLMEDGASNLKRSWVSSRSVSMKRGKQCL